MRPREVQERLRAPIEDASSALDEAVQVAQAHEHGLEFIEGRRSRVAHRLHATNHSICECHRTQGCP